MKNLIYVILITLTPVFAFSQVYVKAPNGDVGVGTDTPTEKLEVAGRILMVDGSVVTSGQSASLMFDRQDASAFIIGAGNDAGMSWDQDFDYELRSNTRTRIVNNRFIQNGPLRFTVKGSTGNVGIGTPNPTEKLHVAGNVFTSGMYLPSDKRLKKNAKTFEYGLEEVMKMKPLTYEYNGKGGTTIDRYNVGIYAQDLEEIAPELVSEFTHIEKDEDDNVISTEQFSKIYDTGIKYMLINAVKEQQDIIEAQDEKIATLEQRLARIEAALNGGTINTDDINIQNIELNGNKAYLEQNQPNPFNSSTLIKYHVPTDATNAVVNIFDTSGKLIHSERIVQMGANQIQIKAGTIAAGTYSYSLIVNGNIVDTKRMVIAK